MKFKYYLRGFGFGMILTALVMSFSGNGAKEAAASNTAASEEKEGVLIDVADAAAAREYADKDKADSDKNAHGMTSEDGDQSDITGDDLKTDAPDEAADAWAGAEGESEEDPALKAALPEKEAEELFGDSAAALKNKLEGSQEASADTDGDDENSVGAGLPLSERISAFSGGADDAPGTRAARGETTSSDKKISNTASAGKDSSNSNATNSKSSNGDSSKNDPTNGGSTKNSSKNSNSANSDPKNSNSANGDSSGRDSSNNESSDKTSGNVSMSASYTISVYPGEGSYTVSRKLAAQGLVESAEVYDTFLCQNGYDKRIRTGNYTITKGATAEEIARIITHG